MNSCLRESGTGARIHLDALCEFGQALGALPFQAQIIRAVFMRAAVARSQRDRLIELPVGSFPIPLVVPTEQRKSLVCLADAVVQFEGLANRFFRRSISDLGRELPEKS